MASFCGWAGSLLMAFSSTKTIMGASKIARSAAVRTLTSSSYVGVSGSLDLTGPSNPTNEVARSAILTPDGKTLFVASYRANKIYEYTLSTANLISSVNTTRVATYTFTDVPTVTGNFGITSIGFSPNGRYLYVTSGEDNEFYQWYLFVPWKLASRVQMGGVITLAAQGVACLNWAGSKISNVRRSTTAINAQYPLSTTYDIDTAGTTDGSAALPSSHQSSGAIIVGGGSHAYVAGYNDSTIYLYTLTVNDSLIGGVTQESTLDLSSQFTGEIGAMCLSLDQTTIYIGDADRTTNGREIYQYTLGAVI